jgi:hypothetical protein
LNFFLKADETRFSQDILHFFFLEYGFFKPVQACFLKSLKENVTEPINKDTPKLVKATDVEIFEIKGVPK